MVMVSFARRLTDLAQEAPDRVALTCGTDRVTRAELEAAANRLARDLAARGVGVGDMVTIALPNSIDWFVAVAAAWKIGAVPQPVSAHLPARELEAIVELADPKVVFGVEADVLAGGPVCRRATHLRPRSTTGRCPTPSRLRGRRRHREARPVGRS